MRPIDKGDSPINGDFEKYQDAHPYLIQRLGNYCSYCERRLEVGLAVEHICPKITNKIIEKKWSNFLLACVQCNSTKGDTDISPENKNHYVWPDEDDTYHMIDYPEADAYKAVPANNLDAATRQRVQNTIDLVDVNHTTDEYAQTTYKDKLAKRQEVASECKRQLNTYINAKAMHDSRGSLKGQTDLINKIESNYEQITTGIISAAKEFGCWSVWMRTFEGIPEIKERLLDYWGTNKKYF